MSRLHIKMTNEIFSCSYKYFIKLVVVSKVSNGIMYRVIYLICEFVAIPAIQQQLHYGYREELDKRRHPKSHVIHLESF
jgi:hypothetical protein